jgi:hypothetical protein
VQMINQECYTRICCVIATANTVEFIYFCARQQTNKASYSQTEEEQDKIK